MAVIRVGGDNRPEPDTVEMFDHKFTVRRVTRSVQKDLEQVEKKLRAAQREIASGEDETDGDAIVGLLCEGISAVLAPNGKQTAAKTVLMKAWKDEALDIADFWDLYERVQESAAKRPTSAPAS